MSNSLYVWILYMTGKTIPFIIPLLLNSTVICIAGISVCYLMARRGALVQSWILRVCLVAVILSPITSLISNSSGLTHIRIPVQYPDSTEKGYLSGHNKVSAIQLNNSRKVRIDLQDAEIGVGTELYNYDGTGNEKRPSENHKVSIIIGRLLVLLRDNSFIIYSIFIITWLISSLYFLIKTVVAYMHFRQIRRTAYPAKQAYITVCKSVSKVLGSKEPRILQTPHTQSVFLAGFFHPCIVLPNDGLDASMATKEIFLHELVHLMRHDYLWNYICQIGKILLPFQPFLWILVGKLKETNDYVCDDYVVKYGNEGRSYAVQLYKPVLPDMQYAVFV